MFAPDAGRVASRALQRVAALGCPGYEIHHIVELNSATSEDADRGNAPENLVSIPVFKHHLITGWSMSKDESSGKRPRDALRGMDWETRLKVGLRSLRKYGVLKP